MNTESCTAAFKKSGGFWSHLMIAAESFGHCSVTGQWPDQGLGSHLSDDSPDTSCQCWVPLNHCATWSLTKQPSCKIYISFTFFRLVFKVKFWIYRIMEQMLEFQVCTSPALPHPPPCTQLPLVTSCLSVVYLLKWISQYYGIIIC